MTTADQRAAVIGEAKSWIATPYHHAAMVKGAGVDCAMLPLAVYRAVGLVPEFSVENYPSDWHMHRDTERYLGIVAQFAHEVPEPTGPGDFVLFKWGRCFAHGAIVVDWPWIIHAVIHVGVTRDRANTGKLADRPRRFFTLWS